METDLKSKKYVVIMDLELTCSEPPLPRQDMEIIEIGIEVVDSKTLDTISHISTVVKPIKNPILTDYCKDLTHISQEEVDNSLNLVDAVKLLFLLDLPQPDEFVWCSWGNDPIWLQKELERAGSDIIFDKRFINLKLIDNTKDKRRGLKKALEANNIEQTQPAHRAWADAMSTANLARKYHISIEDVQVSNTKTYRQKISDEQKVKIKELSDKCEISLEASKYILKNMSWDFSKAKHLMSLLDK